MLRFADPHDMLGRLCKDNGFWVHFSYRDYEEKEKRTIENE